MDKSDKAVPELKQAEIELIDARVQIEMTPPSIEEETIGFGAKCFIAGCLPYRKPKPNAIEHGIWKRENGEYTLMIQGGMKGLPFGRYPRLFILWLTKEVITKQSKRIVLGNSIREFLGNVGVDSSRGRNGAGRNMMEQISLFLESRVMFRRESAATLDFKPVNFVDGYHMFWDPKEPDNLSLFDCYIELGDVFYNELSNYVVPLDLRAVARMQSPMQLDIYQWLAYRLHYIKPNQPSRPTWKQLQMQFGSTTKADREFRRMFKENLKNVLMLYPQARVEVSDNGLILKNSKPPVPKLQIVKPGD